MKDLWKRYKSDQQGNFAMMAAFTMTTVIIIISAAIEISRLSSADSKLQSITDMAALAGAIAADADDHLREEVVLAVIKENTYVIEPMQLSSDPIVVFDDATQTVKVEIKTTVAPVLAQFLGRSELKVSATSESIYATEAITPISISFALDVSGSMGNLTADGDVKIETLQDSIAVLFESLEAGSKDKDKLEDVMRTGMSAYNTALVDQMDMDYGWEDLDDAVDALVASGGTNSVPALQNTYDQLLEDRAYREGEGEDISQLIEYAIFMTDGNNNQPEWDDESYAICEAMKADGIKLYSIAFAAPEKGEALLLDCASSNAGDLAGDKGGKDSDKCMNAGAKGNGKALGHCKDIKEAKSEYYFDASDADAFKKAFDEIGESIAKVYIRIL